MNSKLKFYQSIQFKFALVFVLMLMLTLETVGAVFVRQLERQNVNQFKQTIELPTHVDNLLARQLTNKSTKNGNRQIKRILAEVNNNNITEIRVVDSKGIVRGTSKPDNRDIIGQKSTDETVKNALITNRTHSENQQEGNTRYFINVVPLVAGNNNNVVGAVYLRASMENVYSTIHNITLIYLTASLLTIVIGIALAIIISREITKPIIEMRKQTLRVARGDYSGQVQVMSNDELGQLAAAVNNLSVRIAETQEASDSERRRLDRVLSHMSDGVLGTNRRGEVTIVNETALSLLNVDREEDLLGRQLIDVLNIRHNYSVRELVDSDQQEMLIDMSKDKDDPLILQAYFSPIKHDSGFVSGLVCVIHDVTDQQQEEERRKQFVSNVSHELRTPLTSVKSYVEALSDGAWNDPEVAPRFLKVVSDETDRMIRMINDLLSLSRIDAGTTKLDLEVVNVNELFNYILDRFDMIIKKDDDKDHPQKHYTIKRRFTKRDLWVEVDTDKFTQVIDNIMNNAIKYSPDGGTITARLFETNNHVILSIADQGLGIPRKDIPHIFDRFFRVDKARSRKQGGTGLGLAISKEVVNMLGGQIWVDSIEGEGSTFYISLPYVPYDEEDWDDDSMDQE